MTLRRFVSRRALTAGILVATTMLACSDRQPTAPSPTGARFVLTSINGVALPMSPPGFTSQVIADTLQFGVTSTNWIPKPLALSQRRVRHADGSMGTEEWWYTYDSSEPVPATFDIRLLCADGDSALADCLDGRGQATLDGDGLTIRFNYTGFGVLMYSRLLP